jgi:hypothetical protein
MTTPKNHKIFETQNVDLATFLIKEGIKFLECQRLETNRKIVTLRFLDLERVYLNSEYKKFRDINKYLLSKIHEVLRNP